MRGKAGWMLRIGARADGLTGLKSIAFSGQPIPPVALARPTKGWPCEVTGPRPRARLSCLLVDPEDIVPRSRFGQSTMTKSLLLRINLNLTFREGPCRGGKILELSWDQRAT
jgi:hypothetical protein